MTTAVPRSLLAALWVGGLCAGACMPVHASFLRLGVTFRDGRPAHLAILDVPLAMLHTQNPQLDPRRLAVYHKGRDPVPHRLMDADADGRPDHVRVKIRPDTDEAWLVFVSPGAPGPKQLPAGGQPVRVTYHFRR
ncbi:MAG: hypothetical protein ACYTKC_22120 [Planctomycetota bacterium]